MNPFKDFKQTYWNIIHLKRKVWGGKEDELEGVQREDPFKGKMEVEGPYSEVCKDRVTVSVMS